MATCCAIWEAAQAAKTLIGASFPTCYGIQFADQPRNRNTIISRPMRFDMICEGETLAAIGPRTMVERHRAPADQAQPSLDQWASRADEPNDQGGDRETVPL